MKKDKGKQPARKAYRSSSTTPKPSLPTIDSTTTSDVERSLPATWPDTNASKKAKDSTRESDAGDTDESSLLSDSGKSSRSDEKDAASLPASRAGSWDRWLDRVLSKTPYKKSAKKRTSYSYDSTASSGQKVRIQMHDKEKPDLVARFLGYTEGSCSPMAYPLPSEEVNNYLQSMYFAVGWSCKGFGWAALSAFESKVSRQDMNALRKTVKDVVSEFDNETPEAEAVRSCLLYGLACRGEDIFSDPLCRVRLRKFEGSPLTMLVELMRQRHFDARLPIYEVGTSSTELTEEIPKPRRSATWDPFDVPQYGEARKTKNGKDPSTSASSTKS
ncbi:hypothetical protein KC357_g1156 [Hortaea werneckii]|nr:hypothetical protein KC357_g1156 [Hortaea werneckii]